MSGGAVCSRCHYGNHDDCQISCGIMGGPTCTCHEYDHKMPEHFTSGVQRHDD